MCGVVIPLSDSSDSDDAGGSEKVEPPRRSGVHGPLPGNSAREREEEDETEALDKLQSDLSKNPAKVPIAFAGAAVLAIGLIFGVSNWDRGDNGEVATDVSRPVTDEAGAEGVDTPSGDADEPLPGLEEEDDSTEAELSASGEWEVFDSDDDWLQFSGFDEIVPDRTDGEYIAGDGMDAADLTRMGVSSSSEGTSVTLGFAGDAQDVQANRGELTGNFVIVLSDGERWEVIFQDDGSVKIVSAKPGMSVTFEWLTPQQMLFRLTGITVDPGSTLEATIFLEIFTGINMDVVSLEATR